MHVITGATAGIGRGTVEALSARGESVVAVARRRDVLEALVDDLGEGAIAVVADVATAEGRAAIVAAVDSAPVVGLVHGAASAVPVQSWTDIDPDELTEQFRVHVAAPIALTAALLQQGPVERTIILDSYAASTPRIGWSAYATLKAAAQMSFRAAAQELTDTAVARVFPGAVDTPLLRSILDADPEVPAVEIYRSLRDDGLMSDAATIGQELAALLIDVDLTEFAGRGDWHIGHSIPAD